MESEESKTKSLRERCEELKLYPCWGKGVSKRDLREKIARAEAGTLMEELQLQPNEAELEIFREDPEFYEAIKPFVPMMPDMRPRDTVAKMKRLEGGLIEPQDNWGRILNELRALARDATEGQEDREIMEAINSGDVERIKPYTTRTAAVRRFLVTYPALIFLASHVSPRETIVPFLVSHGLTSVLRHIEIVPEDIAFVTDMKTMKFIEQRLPGFRISEDDFIMYAKNGEEGFVRYALAQNINPTVRFNEAIYGAATARQWHVVKILIKHPRVVSLVIQIPVEDNIVIKEAIRDTKLDIIELLIEKGAEPWPVFKEAVTIGNVEVVNFLITTPKIRNKIDINVAFKFTLTQRHHASKQEDILMLLVQDPELDINEALYNTVAHANSKLAKNLLDKPGINPSYQANSILFIAAEIGMTSIVEKILNHPRFYPNAGLYNFHGSLTAAIKYNHVDTAKAILKDSRINPIWNNYDAFNEVVRKDSVEMAELFINDSRVDKNILFDIALRGNAQNILELLED